jgi:hypothetical protein
MRESLVEQVADDVHETMCASVDSLDEPAIAWCEIARPQEELRGSHDRPERTPHLVATAFEEMLLDTAAREHRGRRLISNSTFRH